MLSASEAKKRATEMYAVSAEAEVDAIYNGKILPAINRGEFEVQVKELSNPAKLFLEQPGMGYSVRVTHLGSREDPQSAYIISWT